MLGLPGGASGQEPAYQFRRHKIHGFDPYVGRIPWRRAWKSTSVFLPVESQWTEEPSGLHSIGSHRVRHDWSNLAWHITWNVRSMNQGKLDMIKREMAKLNIDIIRINELKWMGKSEFNSEDQYMNYYEQEYLKRNGVALIVIKRPKCSTWVQSQKWQNDLHSFPRQTIQHHSNPSLCPNHWRQRNWSWMVLWRPTTPSY